jgi:hypothetical protein
VNDLAIVKDRYRMIHRTHGGVTVLVPDYSVPGVAEAVAREVNEGEWRANYPRSSLMLLAMLVADNAR